MLRRKVSQGNRTELIEKKIMFALDLDLVRRKKLGPSIILAKCKQTVHCAGIKRKCLMLNGDYCSGIWHFIYNQ